jgi:hypothetical protein
VLALPIWSLDKLVLLTVVYSVTNYFSLFSDATSVVDAHIVLSFPSRFSMLCRKTRCFLVVSEKNLALCFYDCTVATHGHYTSVYIRRQKIEVGPWTSLPHYWIRL